MGIYYLDRPCVMVQNLESGLITADQICGSMILFLATILLCPPSVGIGNPSRVRPQCDLRLK